MTATQWVLCIVADSGQTLAVTEQVQRLERKQDLSEARYQGDCAQLL